MRKWDPAVYWDNRYRSGRSSGEGSEGDAALCKAAFVNGVIAEEDVQSVIDWGCGDGHVLSLFSPDVHYIGVDLSVTALERCATANPACSFVKDSEHLWLRGDLALSLDVLFHLVTDDEFDSYLERLFASALRFVIISSTDEDGGATAKHVNRRRFTPVVAQRFPDWELQAEEPGITDADLFLYGRR